ncbi:MAG: DUF4445 domain-containing protein [Acidimicrobiia bacterium]|nr:DUF4445 domain-containing protein [Acidimicrobiia bacterium]
MSKERKVTFTPSGRRGFAAAGSTVLDVARELGADIDSVCGGRGICGRCQVTVGSAPGTPASDTALSPPGPTETSYRGKRPLVEGHRLSCAAQILEDVVIDVPPQSQVHRQVVRKRAEVIAIDVDPVVRLYYVEVAEPTLDDDSSDLGRIQDALAQQWELSDLVADDSLISRLQPALRQGKWEVTVAVHDGSVITGIWPGFRDVALGVAFDVGSTTVAAHLCDLASGNVLASAGVMNPQIRFGEDLMSRVSYVMMNPGGEVALTTAVREAMDDLIGTLVAEADVAREDILEVTVVGNPIMHHLVLGIDPTPLGGAPFALAVDKAVRAEADLIDLEVHPGARLYFLPCIAGHVGADAAAAVLSEGPHRGEAVQLLVDVGTNAEIVLGSSGRLLAASSPTGPAFEGAQISSGQRAAPGAIERVRIDKDTLEPRFKVIGSDLWSDEESFAEAVASTGVTGICGSGIIEIVAELYLAGVISQDGVIGGDHQRIVADGRTYSYVLADGSPQILITQNDVRAIQLAKAALYAGVKLLMDHLGVDAVDEIRLAGAFGSHIDTKYAMVLGLIPDCDLDSVSAAGNAAGTGSMMALLSGEARREIEQVATEIEKIETATEPRFQELFVGAMGIPHATDAFPQLAGAVALPERQQSTIRPERRRRRSRGSEQ